jgi:hypothetical protein
MKFGFQGGGGVMLTQIFCMYIIIDYYQLVNSMILKFSLIIIR